MTIPHAELVVPDDTIFRHYSGKFHEHGGKHAVLRGDWKAIRLHVVADPRGESEFYNLAEDPSEQHNVAADQPEVVRQLTRLMEESRIPSELFHFGSSTYPDHQDPR